ncbi:alpha/beta fold hydrolase [Carboxydochorda subterranea]|uniref:Alpha/beta fold hydrolase n=1 Tax=Carboxydichorda subterranea TaxID=3109565 RepID=A0ABZ1C1Z9_9FIRM|nr:alpha/beta fold hydrolase [Limnochorda sp. L945t]WRP18949.1 alpha/beta fold hydrolase [Limnochorda sp. L945t]
MRDGRLHPISYSAFHFLVGGCLAVALAASGAAFAPAVRASAGQAPQPVAVKESRVGIPHGDHEIPAVFTEPADPQGAVPAVLLIHGFASHKDEVGNFYKRLASQLAAHGVASLRFDFPGSGDSTLPFEVNTVALQVAEARRALEYLASRPSVDPNRMGIVGFSLGGIVAAAVAAGDTAVRALALWSTPGDTPAAFADLYARYYQASIRSDAVEADLGFRKVHLSRAFFDSLFASFPLHDIAGYQGPLLVIAGEKDGAQPRYAREFAQRAGSLDVTLRIIPGADHIFNVLTPDQGPSDEVIELTTRWMLDRLTAR